MSEWKEVEGSQTEKPAALEIGKTTVYKRRNIQQITRKNEDGEFETVWTYQEKTLTLREYALEVSNLNEN